MRKSAGMAGLHYVALAGSFGLGWFPWDAFAFSRRFVWQRAWGHVVPLLF